MKPVPVDRDALRSVAGACALLADGLYETALESLRNYMAECSTLGLPVHVSSANLLKAALFVAVHAQPDGQVFRDMSVEYAMADKQGGETAQ